MTKKQAIKNFTDYLKLHNIPHVTDIDNGCPRFTMVYDAENAPNHSVESCIWFYDDAAEARCYYTAMGAALCKSSEYKDSLLRLLNFINARVFLNSGGGNGLYEPHMLYNPRMYVTEDDCFDITITTIINYDFWGIAPVETADYLTVFCPELLDRLAPSVFGVLLGKFTVDETIFYIRERILEETMPKLTLVIGANATGKTFFIEQNYAGGGAEILDIYDYQQRAYEEAGFKDAIPFGAQFRCLKRTNELLLSDICERLSQGKDVVVEQTFYKAKRRIAYIDEIRKIPDVMIEVYIMQPSDSLWESNLEKRDLKGALPSHKREAEGIEFPNIAEGMDRIYEVVDGEIRQRHDPPKPEIVETARKELAEEAERIRVEDEETTKREALFDSMNTRKFWHYCEVCGKKAYITAEEAHNDGWDYPPKMGWFGMLGPRTCGDCGLADTLFWKVNTSGNLPIVCEGSLTPEELVTWRRIKKEPESLLEEEVS